jgi:hypothetical protein
MWGVRFVTSLRGEGVANSKGIRRHGLIRAPPCFLELRCSSPETRHLLEGTAWGDADEELERMFKAGLKRLGLGAIVLGWLVLAACNGDTAPADAGSTTEDDASVPGKDAEPKDSGTDSPPKDSGADATTPMTCTGDGTLSIVGNYVAADGSQHWLRKTASATTYARVPSGKADNTNPPTIWKITQVCSTEKAFVATSEAGKFARVDWAQSPAGLQLCVAVEDAADAAAALAAGKSTAASPTGCKGRAWTTLTAKDGDL